MSITIITLVDPIPNFERYGISREGEVYDFEKERFVSIWDNGMGYFCVDLVEKGSGKDRKFLLHRLLAITFIPNPENLPCVDHIDHNKQNNSLSNLRWCSYQQNQMNQSIRTGNKSSKFKGVCWYKGKNKWVANIKIDGRLKHLGYFREEKDAAERYNQSALTHFGEFASLNKIE